VENKTNEKWSGRMIFILASIGAAVGLGNIWKFPYTLGSGGGSAFVLVYVLAILLIATPIMLAEMIIGRSARQSAPSAMKTLALQNGSSRHWAIVGWMGQLALVLVLSFYSVIAGWTAAYLVKSASGGLSGLSADEVANGFGQFLHTPGPMIFWHLLFTAITIYIVSKGIKIGLEKVVKILMPALFFTLIALVINSAIVGDFATAFEYLFKPDLSKLTAPVVLAAVGQAFFSVNVNLFRSAITISLGDTLVALLAGLAIFPIVFANGLDPAGGPGLIFVTLSTAFAKMPGGAYVGAAFFVMILFAALTSSISMLETMVARATEVRGLSRTKAASLIGSCTFFLGLVTVYSFSSWEHVYPLGNFEIFAEKTPFDLIDYAVSNVLMPIGGILYAIFAGWWVSKELLVEEIGVGDGALFQIWLLLARVVAPLAVTAIFVFNLV